MTHSINDILRRLIIGMAILASTAAVSAQTPDGALSQA